MVLDNLERPALTARFPPKLEKLKDSKEFAGIQAADPRETPVCRSPRQWWQTIC
jgi:hypothetical protein